MLTSSTCSMRTLNIRTYEELRQVDHRAVIAWGRIMRKTEEAELCTTRRRLGAPHARRLRYPP